MKKSVLLTASVCLIIIFSASAQKWTFMMQDPKANFYDVQKEFNSYWKEKQHEILKEKKRGGKANESEEEESYTQYKRWEEFMEPRVYPSGNRLDPSKVPAEYEKYFSLHSNSSQNSNLKIKSNLNTVQSTTGNWQLVGPTYQGCVGRVNFVRFDPTDVNTIYAGAASGGLWKSTDKGVNWTTNTDNLGSLSMNDLAFDPTNANIMYLANGTGLLKSTDGGATWNTTAITSGGCLKVIVNPVTPAVILVLANGYICRSTDGAASFTNILSGTLWKSLQFKPGDPNIVYAADWQKFYRSTDGGQSFSVITSGLPSAVTINLQIATTAADPNYVYVLASDLSSSGFYGLYLSTDAGLTFTRESNSPNIVGSQGWFALAVAASPINKNEVIVGGLNIFRSIDSGVTWSQISSWSVPTMTGKVHVDIDDLQFNGATIYAGTDGGAFSTANSGTNWSNLCSGLQVMQPYSVGISQITPNLLIVGTQDNGTKTFNGATWSTNIGGDGSICFIDWSSDTYRYASVPPRLAGSIDGGVIYNYVDAGISETTNKMTFPWMQDPSSPATLYVGYTNVWRTTDRCATWSKISTFGGGISSIAVCASNNNYICASTAAPKKIYRTIDGGVNWTDITGTLPVASATMSSVVIKDSDPSKIWVTFSGFSAGNKVYETPDGGTTWNNISGTLPNLPVNAIVYQNGSANGLYIGMDIGVYHIDDSFSDWQLFNTGLPNATVKQLKIQYGSGKLVAATYGRGIWESDLYNSISTGIPQTDNDYFLEIYPNPANNSFDLKLKLEENKTVKVLLSNLEGQTLKIVYNGEMLAGSNKITTNVTDLAAGFYLVNIQLADRAITKKILIQK